MDVIWFDVRTNKYIAALGLKNIHAIKWQELQAARASNPGEANAISTSIARLPNFKTFEGNSEQMMKQVKMYADMGVTDVGLFDWESMFFCDFSHEARDQGFIRGTWFEEPLFGNLPYGLTFRKLLLSFLVRALVREYDEYVLQQNVPLVKYSQGIANVIQSQGPCRTVI